jgi:ATP-dependent Clp protease protease subunit
MKARNKFWEFKNKTNKSADLYIYGEITSSEDWFSDGTEVTPNNFKEELDELGDIDILNLYISSPGGDVFAGQTIYSILKRNKATKNVYIDGLAASIASVVAMAGDTITMPNNAMMMIHRPWCTAAGNANDFRKMADTLDKVCESIQETYLSKAKNMNREDLIALLDAESWLSAKECYDYGFCDVVEENKEISASIPDYEILNRYKNTPKNLQKPKESVINNITEDVLKDFEMRLFKLESFIENNKLNVKTENEENEEPNNKSKIEYIKAKLALECEL